MKKGRLQPGRMLLVDLEQHRLIDDTEIKQQLAEAQPYGEWVTRRLNLKNLPERAHVVHSHSSVLRRHQMFGYTNEEVKTIIAPMAETGAEAIGSMGTDTPLAVSYTHLDVYKRQTRCFAWATGPASPYTCLLYTSRCV